MITKERLQELIEQEAMIYTITINNRLDYFRLKKDWYVMNDELHEYKLSKHAFRHWWIDNLYENKEDAEWIIEFGCIARTQRLVLPTWEETIDLIYSGSFGVQTIIKFDKCKFGYKLQLDGNVYIFVDKGTDTLFMGSLTKENYTLACRKAKELFLGEKK